MESRPSFTSDALLPVLQRISDGVALLAPAPWRVVFANRTLAAWLRKSEHEMADLRLEEVFLDAPQRAAIERQLEMVLSQEVSADDVLLELPRITAERGKTSIRMVRVVSDDIPLIALILQSDHSDLENLTWHVRRIDPLTELPNRAYLSSQLEMLLEGERSADREFAVVFVDLDDFKRVNDRHGHLVGDQVLREVSQRLRHCVREGDHVTRYGGDEFVILLERVSGLAEIEPVLARIRESLSEPIEMSGECFMLSLSIGVAMSAPHHRSPEDVLGEADREMYAAKRRAFAAATAASTT